VGYGGSVFSTGLLLALPIVAALLIANLALGILNRAAPQIGIFQVGFPVTMLVGLLLLQLMVPNLMPFFQRIFDVGIVEVGRVVGGL
jgi:flagellar biosynthetic protein FliR